MTHGGDESFPGLGPRRGLPRLAAAVDWGKLQLDEQQGFVLAQIDGRTTLSQICLVVPFPEAKTVEILQRLHAVGVIEIPGVRPPPTALAPAAATAVRRAPSSPAILAPPTPRKAPPSSPVIVPATGRAPSSPALPVVPRASSSSPSVPQASSSSSPAVPRSSSSSSPAVPRASSSSPSVPLSAAPVEEAVVEAVDLPAEVCRRVDEMLALIGKVAPAELLGVPPDADKKEVRRVYFRLSKEFHPDRYYGKRLGPYKRRLQQVFAALSDAVEQLVGK